MRCNYNILPRFGEAVRVPDIRHNEIFIALSHDHFNINVDVYIHLIRIGDDLWFMDMRNGYPIKCVEKNYFTDNRHNNQLFRMIDMFQGHIPLSISF